MENPAYSWAVFGTTVIVALWYYGVIDNVRALVPADRQADAPAPTNAQAASKRKQRLKEGNKAKKEQASKPKAEPEQRSSKAPTYDEEPDMNEEKDSIMRLAKAQAGTQLSSSTKKETSSRTVKQNKAGGAASKAPAAATQKQENTGSTSVQSPSGKDVSDMLEAPAAGPSVVRVTESTKPQLPKKVQEKAAPPAQETKKQRQNRQKKEKERAAREEQEKERKVLQNQQMRTAREARGEPARNGIPAKAPANSAWDQAQNSSEPPATTNGASQLLDTFDNEATSSAPARNGTGAAPSKLENSWIPVELTEAEQVQAAKEDVWETVASKKGKKKDSGASSEKGDNDDGAVKPVEAPVKAVQPKVTETKSKPIDTGKYKAGPGLYDNLPETDDW